MSFYIFVVLIVSLECISAFPGEYVPKSFYTIDKNGQKSDLVYLRKSREVPSRFPRATYGAVPGGEFYQGGPPFVPFYGPENIADAINAGLENTFQQIRSLSQGQGIPYQNGGGGGVAYSGSFSDSGPEFNNGKGPVIYSRFAQRGGGSEKELVTGNGGGIHASSSADGPHGAFSFSSTSVDENGKVHYNTQSRQF